MRKLYSIATNYEGTINALRGCLNDQKDMVKLMSKYGVESVTLTGSEVTKENVINLYKQALDDYYKHGTQPIIHNSGHGLNGEDPFGVEEDGLSEGHYLDSGEVLWDYELLPILKQFPVEAGLVVFDDSCFSGGEGSTRGTQKQRSLTTRKKKAHRAVENNYLWVAACQSYQTAADASFMGKFNGAFTYYLMKALKPDTRLKRIFKRIKLPSRRFDQIPNVFGSEEIYNTILL